MVLSPSLIEQLEPYLGPYADGAQCAESMHACLCGFGCVARPLSQYLHRAGTRNFTVLDKKSYTMASVASQCELAEVGRPKVSVAAELLGDSSKVQTFQSDVSEVPVGILRPGSIVIATFDNRFADATVNAMAIEMKAVLIKVNIEPLQNALAVRGYDYRSDFSKCAVCAFRDSDHLLQRHPRSCESVAVERSTSGPRTLAAAAGDVGGWFACRVAAGNDAVFGKELLIHLNRQRLIVSDLPERHPCVADHRAGRANLTYLRSGPADVSLRDLLPQLPLDQVQVEFCHEVSTRSRCVNCRREDDAAHWIAHATQAVGRCVDCGGNLVPIPFWSFSTVSARSLESVVNRPLSAWGVPPFAVLRVVSECEDRSFVLNADQYNAKQGIE